MGQESIQLAYIQIRCHLLFPGTLWCFLGDCNQQLYNWSIKTHILLASIVQSKVTEGPFLTNLHTGGVCGSCLSEQTSMVKVTLELG